MRTKTKLIVLIYLLCSTATWAKQEQTTQQIDWKTFLGQHDLVWNKIVPDYYAGAIMGNGLLGNSIYKEGDSYKFHIGRVDVTEGRMPKDFTEYANLYHGARLPIGHFLMQPNGKVNSDDMRLTLWDATTTGNIHTEKGIIGFKSFVHATSNVIVIETTQNNKEVGYEWKWIPLKAISPRYAFGNTDYPQEYLDNPNPEVEELTEDGINFSIQPLLSGKTYVVAWKQVEQKKKSTIYVTISYENSTASALAKAKESLNAAHKMGVKSLEKSHKTWWHNYYPASFASFGNAKMESFYWIQQYKYACLTRPDQFVIDLQGPWALQKTPWPAIWMNLNTQLTYAPLAKANRAEMMLPLWKALNDNVANLERNALGMNGAIAMGRSTSYHMLAPIDPKGGNKMLYEVGNLTWLLYYYYEYCMLLDDKEELIDRLYPLLKRSIAYYEQIKIRKEDGKYHLPMTASPEYKPAENANYDLAVLKWGLQTLIEMNQCYQLKDSGATRWKDFLDNLVDYPTDQAQGFMIGKDVKLEDSHRHYSHLMMIYPFYMVNWEQPENRELIEKSIAHWQSMTQYLQGYSFTGSSAMYSMMGDGERAEIQLQKLLDHYIKPNTLYKETGPVIETPLTASASLQDMLLQSWGGKIRVFPAIPASWESASFIDFRTEGAFLVSANRSKHITNLIQIKSEKGGVCSLQTGMNLANIELIDSANHPIPFKVIDAEKGFIAFNTTPSGIYLIKHTGVKTSRIAPVKHNSSMWNQFGIDHKE